MKFACPACGAEVQFRSRSSIFGVCASCRSTLVRHDLNLEKLGQMSEMPQDLSPLQLGSGGIFQKVSFQIVGRQRMGWQNGAWNEWYAMFEDGKNGWLADGQGFYALSFPFQCSWAIPDVNQLSAGQEFRLNGQTFLVEDVKEVTCLGSEGELPVQSVQGRQSISVDLVGENKKFACLVFSPEGNQIFLGRYVELDELKMTNLREFDGW